jgi:lipoyl(octanoyl) transferase
MACFISPLNQSLNGWPQISTKLKVTSKPQQQLGKFQKLEVSQILSGDTDVSGNGGRYVRLYDFSEMEPLEYTSMWELQKSLVQNHLERILPVESQQLSPDSQFLGNIDTSYCSAGVGINTVGEILELDEKGKGRDCIIMLQHQPVYTLGTGSDVQYVKVDQETLQSLGIQLVRIERGGEVTYHGPGQLTVYPIVDLRGYKKDIHWYMRALEEAIIIALENVGVKGAVRENDATGVWVDNKKVAALGVKVKRWVTMHGLAVNVDKRALGNFEGIVPCGLIGRDVGCVNDFLDEPVSIAEFALHLKRALQQVFEIECIP